MKMFDPEFSEKPVGFRRRVVHESEVENEE